MKLLSFILCLALAAPAHAAQVRYVHDGDTFRTTSGQSIRLWGVDAPELKQPMGYQARDHLKAMVAGRPVKLSCKGKSFKRRVCRASVMVNGQAMDLGAEMVGWGMAYDYAEYSHGAYSEAETFARQ